MMRRTTVMVELARLQGTVAGLAEQLRVLQDHETRMRRIERYMYGIPAAIVVALASAVGTYIRH
jgi:hypothetical protein